MSAPTQHTVATGCGGRFDCTAGADAAAVLAAVRSSILQVCEGQLSAEVKRLETVLADLASGSGSASEAVEAVRAASLVVDEAAAVVAVAAALLHLRGRADDEATGWWDYDNLELHIKQSRMLMAAMERAPPERRRSIVNGLVGELTLIGSFAYTWCHMPPPPAYRARPASRSAVVDALASGIEAVQVSAQE